MKMLNWWLVTVLGALTFAGLFFLDDFFLKKIRCARKILPHSVEKFFRIFSFTLFIFVTLFVLPLIFLLYTSDFYSAGTFFASCFLATGIAFVGKYFFKRIRPFGHQTYLGEIDSAFPSAHTTGSFAAAFILMVFWPALAIPLLTFATIVAFSRMYLELHFFSDVAGGILIAHLMTAFVIESDLLTFFGF